MSRIGAVVVDAESKSISVARSLLGEKITHVGWNFAGSIL